MQYAGATWAWTAHCPATGGEKQLRARVVRRLLRSHAYDLVHCEWTPYFSYTRGAEVPVVVGTHNIEAQIWARHAEHASRPAMRRFLQVQARRMEAYERGVFSRIAAATACTEADAETIRAWGGKDVVVVPNGVDTGHFIPGPADEVERDTLVFTASMDSRPNQDAVVWFLDEVLPRLSDTPVRFVVVGRAPPAWLVQRAASLDGVEVTGAVDDVAPFLARAGIVVVPLRIGGGSRLKILEAAAAERPVVSTTVGAEGLGFADGEHLLLADTPEAFADAVRRLRGDEALGSSLARAARAEALRRYDWGAIADIQAAFWKRVAGRAASVS